MRDPPQGRATQSGQPQIFLVETETINVHCFGCQMGSFVMRPWLTDTVNTHVFQHTKLGKWVNTEDAAFQSLESRGKSGGEERVSLWGQDLVQTGIAHQRCKPPQLTLVSILTVRR